MPSLPDELFSLVERKVLEARTAAEAAAEAAVTALAVNRAEPFRTLGTEQRRLRNALRARARQLGDGSQHRGLPLLVEEIAYQQWHRMLFARFLAENGLLMHPTGIPVTLRDCAELAPEEGEPDAWALAARYASAMLPGIFRQDDPVVQVRFAPEGRLALEGILDELPSLVFTADDSLGWMYQFWQSRKKDEVNASERKIGGADIAPVTQLFTEDYMVRFLLENSLGAWWAARHPDSPLVKTFTYLRFREDGTPAAGTFPGWPDCAAEITVMDPCCGSGHFLVVAFLMLWRMRIEEEDLGEAAVADAVLRDNLFGLEIDPRCTQIAAFALVLVTWKSGGYRSLPAPNVACCGIPVQGQLGTWTNLAGEDANLRMALEHMYELFKNSPDLGSLIDPIMASLEKPLLAPNPDSLRSLVKEALETERTSDMPSVDLFESVAQRLSQAARLLSAKYSLVVTNVPYLTRRKQSEVLRAFCESHHAKAKDDLATCFLQRCLAFCVAGGAAALVTPQNWLFLASYQALREELLTEFTWEAIARLGPGAFRTIGGHVVNVALLVFTRQAPATNHSFVGFDTSKCSSPREKAEALRSGHTYLVEQVTQFNNPDRRITLEPIGEGALLEEYGSCYAGILNGDSPRYQRFFWEIIEKGDLWVFQQSTVLETTYYGGRERVILFDESAGHLRATEEYRRVKLHNSDQRGNKAWGKKGVAINQMGSFPVSLYTGDKFDSNVAVFVPDDQSLVPAIWAFCSSPAFQRAVRRIDQKMNVTNATFAKVPFDIDYWQDVAETADPLPIPHSDNPTQWLFKGHLANATRPLQVSVARMLGYDWPMQESDELCDYADKDGLVCLVPVAHETQAGARLRALLAAFYEKEWSVACQEELLGAVGFSGQSLEDWLREGFFVQHCILFYNRPFVWHIWDGRSDGFSALVNYHRLDSANLNKLIYTYLGDWIRIQGSKRDAGEASAEGRLVAALDLQKKLEAIRDGEPPYDIYVRWKPLHEQPIGWNPDLNDGVRVNIRPFVTAGVLRSRFTINWNKDRGKNPDGSERLNDLHFTVAEKQAARRQWEASHRGQAATKKGLL